MEVYLYRCEVCKVVICVDDDRGRTYYMDCCGVCTGWSYYEKIEIRSDPTKRYTMIAYCPTAEEGKANGNSDTRTDQET